MQERGQSSQREKEREPEANSRRHVLLKYSPVLFVSVVADEWPLRVCLVQTDGPAECLCASVYMGMCVCSGWPLLPCMTK